MSTTTKIWMTAALVVLIGAVAESLITIAISAALYLAYSGICLLDDGKKRKEENHEA